MRVATLPPLEAMVDLDVFGGSYNDNRNSVEWLYFVGYFLSTRDTPT